MMKTISPRLHRLLPPPPTLFPLATILQLIKLEIYERIYVVIVRRCTTAQIVIRVRHEEYHDVQTSLRDNC